MEAIKATRYRVDIPDELDLATYSFRRMWQGREVSVLSDEEGSAGRVFIHSPVLSDVACVPKGWLRALN
jgi:hypothetical protein